MQILLQIHLDNQSLRIALGEWLSLCMPCDYMHAVVHALNYMHDMLITADWPFKLCISIKLHRNFWLEF